MYYNFWQTKKVLIYNRIIDWTQQKMINYWVVNTCCASWEVQDHWHCGQQIFWIYLEGNA